MSAADDLKAKVERLRSQLKQTENSWYDAMIAEYPVKVDDLLNNDGHEYKVTRLGIKWDKVVVWARKKTKNGWHSTETHLWRFTTKSEKPF